VLGISDGLVTNVSLILGVAGANAEPHVVRLAGFASLVAGACSMAVGEYISMQAQRELLERVLDDQRNELRRDPSAKIAKLADAIQRTGTSREYALAAAQRTMSDPDEGLDVYVRLVLGVNPHELGSPIAAAFSSLVTFAFGAFVPLVPWLFTSGNPAALISIALAAAGSAAIGGYLGWQTGRGIVVSALRQLFVIAIAAGITYLVGRIFRVAVA
jgi:VIT1/CCC1 family predicted Fe2+/Mn2+ transporter